MQSCWAAPLGDCSDKISREHIITNGVFIDDGVRVKGLSWCLDEFKTIGLASLVRNVLCTAHNSRLSEADNCAIAFRKAICDSIYLSEARKLQRPQVWKVERFPVNGYSLERWCVKTLITIAYGGQAHIGRDASVPGEPTLALVETAFGLRQFEPPRAGLYWVGDVGEIRYDEGIVVSTFVDRSNNLEGARFWFWGLNFLLVLNDGPVWPPFTFISQDGQQTMQPKTWYRPRGIHLSVHGHLSHILEFSWQAPNDQRPADPKT